MIAGMDASLTTSIRLSKLKNLPLPAPARMVNNTTSMTSIPIEIRRRIVV